MIDRISALVLVGLLFLSVSSLCFSATSGESFQQQFHLPQDPDNVLQQILARKEFHEASAWSLLDRLYERLEILWERAMRWLFSRFPRIGPVKTDLNLVWMILTGLLIGLAVIGIVWLFRKGLISVIGKVRGSPRGEQAQERADTGDLFSRHLLKRAAMAAEEGDYSGALVFLFRFTLMRLDETGRLIFHPGQTNREILESLKDDELIRSGLTEMVPLFNRVRYGNAPCCKAEYERALDLSRAVTGRL